MSFHRDWVVCVPNHHLTPRVWRATPRGSNCPKKFAASRAERVLGSNHRVDAVDRAVTGIVALRFGP